MKVESTKENLFESISLAERVSGKNLPLPILNSILLSAQGKKFSIRATNLEIGIESEISAKVVREGEVAVPGGILTQTLSSLYEDSPVLLEVVQGNLSLTTPHGKTLIKALPSDEFPTIPLLKDTPALSLKRDDILRGLKAVWYSASHGTVKPEISSVYLYLHDQKLFFVATDSFRLAEKVIPSPALSSFEPLLIPIRSVPEIVRVLERSDENVSVRVGTNQIVFASPKLYLTSRLLNGVFPDYRQIIPKGSTTEAVVLKQDFLNALKKITVFSDKFNQVGLHVSPSKKRLTLSSKNPDVGETVETLDAALSGDELDINFNHRYLTDCFQSFNTDSISLLFSGLSKPLIIKGISDNSFLYLVMPMNR